MFCNVIATFPHDRLSRLYRNLSYATLRMHDEWAQWQRVAHFLISETEMLPNLAKIYRRAILQSIGAVVDSRHYVNHAQILREPTQY